KFDDVLKEIPKVREDLGLIPLVTPTSQIVGTQAVLNVLTGERYKSISKETAGILKGEYGAAPAEFNAELLARVLDGTEAITCRPADLLSPEMDKLTEELVGLSKEKGIELAVDQIDDVLTYALFPQIGLKFLQNRGDASAFEPVPVANSNVDAARVGNSSPGGEGVYTVSVSGEEYVVQVSEGGVVGAIQPAVSAQSASPVAAPVVSSGEAVPSPLAGNIFKVLVSPGQQVEEGDTVMILEAMKMETEISAPKSGVVGSINVKEGDSVQVGHTLLSL
ncbi:oxaloacetate decarboxylase, partial [Marinomonas sp.]|nr:oxaloacetate decarboxylase [Marinomonas sp.]